MELSTVLQMFCEAGVTLNEEEDGDGDSLYPDAAALPPWLSVRLGVPAAAEMQGGLFPSQSTNPPSTQVKPF